MGRPRQQRRVASVRWRGATLQGIAGWFLTARRLWAAPVLSALCLTACGGGDGGGPTTSASGGTTVAVTRPGAPTIGNATAGDGSASIAFTAPASNGGGAISGYTATCSAGAANLIANGAASPITVTGLTNGTAYSCTVTATNSAGTGAASGATSVTPAASAPSAAIDPARIPIGDGKLSTTMPRVGFVFSCTNPSSPNPPGKSPWVSADGLTWDSTAKLAVQGAVTWASSFVTQIAGNSRQVDGNGLPSHVTGNFPIAATDPARQYDANPNRIQSVAIAWGLPANPVAAPNPTCTGLGAIGVLLSGARIFNALDADGRDAVAHEVQDSCDGHPQGAGIYHYHNVSRCLQAQDDPAAHSPLVGYIADGFGLYGLRGEGGKPLTNADLDECHGHSHALTINGVQTVQYHYHATKEYPYTVGCYRGTPVAIR